MSDNPGKTLGMLMQQTLASASRFIPMANPMPPFAITVVPDGKGELIGGELGAPPPEVMASFYERFRELARSGQLTAFAIAFEVSVTDKNTGEVKDALKIRMEHERFAGGEACVVPFEREGESVKWGSLAQTDPVPMVWSHGP